jgi:hypothetical protein
VRPNSIVLSPSQSEIAVRVLMMDGRHSCSEIVGGPGC